MYRAPHGANKIDLLTLSNTYSKAGCKFEEGSMGEMFKKSRARELEGKEDDDSPPEPR